MGAAKIKQSLETSSLKVFKIEGNLGEIEI